MLCTVGRGILHAEMPNPQMNGLQLWVNLKSSEKMVEPAYQELKSADIPRGEQNGVKVVVIAGESMGIHVTFQTYETFLCTVLFDYCSPRLGPELPLTIWTSL